MWRTLSELVQNVRVEGCPVGVRICSSCLRPSDEVAPPSAASCGTFNFTHSLFNLRAEARRGFSRCFPRIFPDFPPEWQLLI